MTERVIRCEPKERDREGVTELHDWFRDRCSKIHGDKCVFSVTEINQEVEKRIREELIVAERNKLFATEK